MNILVRAAAAALLCIWPLWLAAAPGDFVKVTLTNGQEIDGRIVSEDNESLTIETTLAEIPLARNKIQSIEVTFKSDGDADAQKANALHSQAQAAFQKQQYLEAIQLSINSLKEGHGTPDLPLSLIRQSTQGLLNQLRDQIKAGDHNTAIQNGVQLEKFTGEPEFFKAFEDRGRSTNPNSTAIDPNGQPTSEQYNQLRVEAGAILGSAYLGRGKTLIERRDMNLAAAIRSDLESAIRYAGSSSPVAAESLYQIALLAELQGNPAEALQYVMMAKKVSNDSDLLRHIDEVDKRLRAALDSSAGPGSSAAAPPRPTPIQRVAPQPQTAPVVPTTTVEETWIDKTGRWMGQRTWTRVIWNYLIIFIEGGYWIWLVAVLAGYLIIWRIPRWFIERRMRRGDFKAAEHRKMVMRFGLPALIPYLKSRTRETKKVKRCESCNASLEGIEDYKNFRFDLCPNCGNKIEPIYTIDDYIEKLVKSLDGLSPGAEMQAGHRVVVKDAMTKLVRSIITMAVNARATDLHIEPVVDHLKFRARVDGMLFDLSKLPHKLAPSIVNSLKVMANLDITEKRVPQDGNFSLWVEGHDIDLRVSTSPVANGESVSLRLLDHRSIDVDAHQLGLEDDNLAKFTKCIMSPNGLVLVTGPSGSGKSTTLYVALQKLNSGEKNIITIEDPIEYKVKGVNQSQINPAAEFTFATALRSMLRQDPDVIMVGEVRDRETAQLAIDAALTGHLVLTTLHTVDSSGSVPRLADLGCDPNRLSVCLLCAIAQRLIRLNCQDCSQPYTPTSSLLEDLEMPLPSDELKYYKGRGCAKCNQSGYYGRTGIFEILVPSDKLREAVEKRMTTLVIRELACSAGMRTLREEGLLKIIQGKTTLEEILRVTSN